ncbi:hypothetical protein CEXT_675831 [Caerostris extrusa]|uniref:Uncharacterized protein n=1 Tax=Caerostris extrusa TaxID=172846 RepID=A0AAV4XAN4_CAEEX|nr:hypothetical protein CEXT_675831 [Caerostris extrusa]
MLKDYETSCNTDSNKEATQNATINTGAALLQLFLSSSLPQATREQTSSRNSLAPVHPFSFVSVTDMQHPLAETSGAATNGKTNGLITELQYSVWQQKGTTTLANDGPEFTADKRLPFVWGRKGFVAILKRGNCDDHYVSEKLKKFIMEFKSPNELGCHLHQTSQLTADDLQGQNQMTVEWETMRILIKMLLSTTSYSNLMLY